jgi:hypothetical protein
MLTYCIGIAFLIACVFGVPLLRKLVHDRTLKGLAMEGVTVLPRFWSLSGLRIERSSWTGEMAFAPAGPSSGRPGHLRLTASFKPSPSTPAAPAPETRVRTGDADFDERILVEGDPAFARKLLGPEMRERLVELDRMGGRVLAIGESTVEIDGPLMSGTPSLKRFLELCDAIVTGTAVAAAS